MKKILILGILVLSAIQMNAQSESEENIETTKEEKKESNPNKAKIIWLPVLASSPANGFMFGVAPSSNWLMGDPETTSYSSLLGSFIYTTLNQFLFTTKGTVFTDGNKSVFMTDIRYFITSQPTYGLGTGPQSAKLAGEGIEYQDGLYSQAVDGAQMMKFNFLRVYGTYFKRLGEKKLYAGIGYHLDLHRKINDQLLDLDTVPPVITSHYAHSKKHGFDTSKYSLSGVSGNLLYDTRDNTVNPQEGRYALLTLKYNPKFLGSSKSSGWAWAEYRDYFTLNYIRPRNLLAFWAYGSFELGNGTLPYMDLPALGWDQFGRSGRAFPQGRFRGNQLLYSELEWRFPLLRSSEKLGGVVFTNATTANNADAGISLFDYVNFGYGLGLRFMLNEKSRTNLCLDYARGSYGASGFYLSVNEVF